MLFQGQRLHFFKPLTGKYRAVVVECLRLLYGRLYSANADYGEALRREQVLDVMAEALARAPVLEPPEGEGDDEIRVRNPREQAAWVLNLLLEHGWLEKHVDQATLQSTFPFSRMGRLFTLALVEVQQTSVRTRHRNTRNTLNALEAFCQRGEVHDLLDAYEYSERIISDFTDVIAELEERKRELVQQLEAELLVQQATEQFFDFMEKRFQPDVAIRLSADSVEKHRDAIGDVLERIRRKNRDFKHQAEIRLREQAPELIQGRQSVLLFLLDGIELRMRNAADLMLPALRRAIQGFTKRADIIIRQLSYLHGQPQDDVLDLCQRLGQLPEAEYANALHRCGQDMASLQLRFTDPEQMRLSQRKTLAVVDSRIPEAEALDATGQRDLLIQQLLDQAFVLSNNHMRCYLEQALVAGNVISNRDLPVHSATDLLAMAHIIEVAANNRSQDWSVVITPTGSRTANTYFDQFDEFLIELRPGVSTASEDTP